MTDSAAIEFRRLVKDYGGVRALDGIDLRVEQGEIFGFLGPNGAGKTTAIRCLLDLIRPTSGQALVLGLDSRADSVAARARIGYLPGDLSLYDTLTGEETIAYFASLRPKPLDHTYLDMLITRLTFEPQRPVGALSKGNRQKLGLILAMMNQPEVLVLDEPTAGLDPLAQAVVEELLGDVAGEGRTVFFSSHILSEVDQICHRVGIIRAGKIVAVEELAMLKGRALHVIEVTFARPVPPGAFDLPGVQELRRDGSVIHLEVRSNLDAVLKAIARYEVVDLRTEQPSLEQTFLAFYQESPAARQEASPAVP
ncbi:MAG TPA: ABC transporter ATP-binding protein [Dehalococcoidia bacterium]|nr:ABC transporter ATP-binding protein [Dehalococcoidia bacterium]